MYVVKYPARFFIPALTPFDSASNTKNFRPELDAILYPNTPLNCKEFLFETILNGLLSLKVEYPPWSKLVPLAPEVLAPEVELLALGIVAIFSPATIISVEFGYFWSFHLLTTFVPVAFSNTTGYAPKSVTQSLSEILCPNLVTIYAKLLPGTFLYPLGTISWFILNKFPITIPPIPSNVIFSSVGIIVLKSFLLSNLLKFAKKSLYAKSKPPNTKFVLALFCPFIASK